MEFDFKITEDDFLTFQLFNASRSDKINKDRKRRRSLVPILYIVVSVIFLLLQNYAMAFGFFLISVLWFVFYPMIERRKYINQFKKYIEKNYKDKFFKSSHIILKDDFWHTKDEEKEAKFALKDIKELNEIRDYFFIQLMSGYILIIPKREISNLTELSRLLKEAALKHSFVYNKYMEWEWR